ncbi:DUF4148 domain-containing protein [Paraburkholderia pallida]|uniref:DUF4148 domain-containing protein n=1 Tax=Paraburkholderia pallida TaxID=2547399 RepID=A0A4P7D3S1_9BURK|nr:DUF4148 domain-containing protein [Paraburkholderia pallida]QBR03411.1 DUF4148 domain-containing protein [Paraburkholderia pallida]
MSKNGFFVLLTSTAMLMTAATHVMAQDPQASASGAVPSSEAPSTKAQRKQARKEARKQARAKTSAEMKSLQGAGYQPMQTPTDYPQNLLNAEKKAGAAKAASQ